MEIKKYEYMSYEDFLRYIEIETRCRCEYDNGYIYYMTPVHPNHNLIQKKIVRQLDTFLSGTQCETFTSEVAVKFTNKEETQQFEPDIMVVCNLSQFDGAIYKGIPRLVVEILSWTTKERDTGTKLEVYEKFQVPEYWIVNPFELIITVYSNNVNGSYNRIVKYGINDEIEFDGCFLKIHDVFQNLI